ncbi:MAG: YeeE/YedE family protein [Aeromonadaceae bacterium]|nr:YeeE/YedE family protein [Aeromonadaceae bacterium]
MMLWISLLSGTLFGVGLTLSGMVLPQKVQGFLDVAGNWDPSLALVMAGALLIFMPGYFLLVRPRQKSLLGEEFHLAKRSGIDLQLVAGSALFGVGWGLVGICPGPAIASLLVGGEKLLLFVVAMLAGIKLMCLIKNTNKIK